MKYMNRRNVLRGLGTVGAGIFASTGVGIAAHNDNAEIVFDNNGTQVALVPPGQGPLEAAIRVEKADLPDGGWVVITQDATTSPVKKTNQEVVGWSSQRLGSGHFNNLLVQVRLSRFTSGDNLYASLWGNNGSQGDAFPGESYNKVSEGVIVNKSQ